MKPHPFPRYRPLTSRSASLIWQTDDGGLRIDRRRENREHADGTLTATYSDGAARYGIARLELADRSGSGLGVVSKARIEPGMIVSLQSGDRAGTSATAIAVRCEPEEHKFRIGLSLAARAAA